MRTLQSTVYGIVLLGLVSHAGAVTLSLLPSSQTATAGDTVSLDLVIDGLGDFSPDSLGGFDLDIKYDESALNFVGYTLGPYLGDVALGEAVDFSGGDTGGGIVNIAELSLLENDDVTCVFCVPPYLDDIQPGSFTLVTLELSVAVLPPGSSAIVSIDTVNGLSDGVGSALTLDATGDAVISAVPVPAAVWLFGSGILCMAGMTRRRR